jgi:hypothetical protein
MPVELELSKCIVGITSVLGSTVFVDFGLRWRLVLEHINNVNQATTGEYQVCETLNRPNKPPVGKYVTVGWIFAFSQRFRAAGYRVNCIQGLLIDP